MRWVRLLVASSVIVGCTGSSTPATTPTSFATTSSTTTTTQATTTTVDRLTEIEAIYQDLEERRLDALYRGDVEAYRSLFANEAYMEESLVLFDELTFDSSPQVDVEVVKVVEDRADCIAAENILHRADLGGSSGLVVQVLELRNAAWLISYVGTGWTCEGPHPFDT